MASTAWRKKESLSCKASLVYYGSIRSDHTASRVEEPAMPGPKPPAVLLSEEERQTLHTMIRAHKTPQHLSFRAQVILLLAEGLSAPDVARRLGTTRRGRGRLPRSVPSSGARSSLWPVSPRRLQAVPSAIGCRAGYPLKAGHL